MLWWSNMIGKKNNDYGCLFLLNIIWILMPFLLVKSKSVNNFKVKVEEKGSMALSLSLHNGCIFMLAGRRASDHKKVVFLIIFEMYVKYRKDNYGLERSQRWPPFIQMVTGTTSNSNSARWSEKCRGEAQGSAEKIWNWFSRHLKRLERNSFMETRWDWVYLW